MTSFLQSAVVKAVIESKLSHRVVKAKINVKLVTYCQALCIQNTRQY